MNAAAPLQDPSPPASATSAPASGVPISDVLAQHPVCAEFHRAMGVGLGNPVTVVVRVVSISAPEIIDERIVHRVKLHARDRHMDTLALADDALLATCEWALRRGVVCTATGAFVAADAGDPDGKPAKARRSPARFRLDALEPLDQVLPLLGPSAAEVQVIGHTVDALAAQPDGLADYIQRTFFAHYHVAAGSLSDRQHRALRLVMLQSLSCGQIPGQDHNPRLSLCISSGPGRGKKLLVQLAAALAPVHEWVKPGETSVAGLTACVSQRGGAFTVTPGSLPRTHMGTCIIDDFHRTQRQQLHQIEGGLMSVAEDGCVTVTKAGSAHYDAACALLLTGNPASTLPGMSTRRRSRGGQGIAAERADDLGLPLDLLSRIDVLVWLDSDADPLDSAQEMAARPAPAPTPRGPEEAPVLRELRLLTAYLRDRFPVVDLSNVGDALHTAMGELGAVLREYTAKGESGLDADALVRRISNSLRKLTGAAARLRGRGVAEERDVAEAFEMLTLKLEVLRWLAGDVDSVRPLQARSPLVDRAAKLRELRQQDIRSRYGGMAPVSDEVIGKELNFKPKLVRQELWTMRVEPVEGKWQVPTQDQHERNLERRAREAALRRTKERAAVVDDPVKLAAVEARHERERAAEDDPEAAINAILREMKDERFAWESPLPGRMRVAFKDVLPKVHVDLRPYLKALRFLNDEAKRSLSEILCDMAIQEHEDRWAPFFRYLANEMLYPAGREVMMPLQPEIDKLLFPVDRETRGLNALALLWESPVCDDMVGPYLKVQKLVNPDLPPKLVEAVDAMLARIAWKESAAAKEKAAPPPRR